MNKKVLFTLCILFLIMSTGCSNQDVIDENNTNINKIDTLEKDKANLQVEIDGLKGQIEEYKGKEDATKQERQFYLDFIAELASSVSDDDLTKIAQDQWTYAITVNDKPVPADGMVEVDADKVMITVSEEQASYRALPIEIHNKGKISGDLFATHINFLTSKPNDTTGSEDSKVTSTTYTFNHLGDESIVNLEITSELQERLGIQTNMITIKKADQANTQDTKKAPSASEDKNATQNTESNSSTNQVQ